MRRSRRGDRGRTRRRRGRHGRRRRVLARRRGRRKRARDGARDTRRRRRWWKARGWRRPARRRRRKARRRAVHRDRDRVVDLRGRRRGGCLGHRRRRGGEHRAGVDLVREIRRGLEELERAGVGVDVRGLLCRAAQPFQGLHPLAAAPQRGGRGERPVDVLVVVLKGRRNRCGAFHRASGLAAFAVVSRLGGRRLRGLRRSSAFPPARRGLLEYHAPP